MYSISASESPTVATRLACPPAERIFTISHGEERPAHDNAQESTRQLNRRAVLIVRLTEEGSR